MTSLDHKTDAGHEEAIPGKVLQARHERQGDRLPCVIPGFGARGDVAEQLIRVGLEPPRIVGSHRPVRQIGRSRMA